VRRAASLAAVVLLGFGLGAGGCGDDESGGDAGAAADGGPTATAQQQPLATAGPGVTQGDPDAEAIVGVLDDYARSVRAKDAGRICRENFSAEVVAQLRELGATCESFLQDTVAQKAPGYRIEIEKIEIDGDRATVAAREGSDGRGEQLLVKEDGRWRLTLPKAR